MSWIKSPAAKVDAAGAGGYGGDVHMGLSWCRSAEGTYIFFEEQPDALGISDECCIIFRSSEAFKSM